MITNLKLKEMLSVSNNISLFWAFVLNQTITLHEGNDYCNYYK